MPPKLEDLILSICRKHPEGVPDRVLAAELPETLVDDRAVAINSLLSSLKLQVCVGRYVHLQQVS
jgi:hypothetical protein